MLIKTIKLQDTMFFHARPAAFIATEAKKYGSLIMFTVDGQVADAKKPLSIMRLGIPEDKIAEITTDGSDEEEAMQAMEHVLDRIACAV